MLGLEARRTHRVEHPGFFDEVQAVRQQTFANREAWEALALQHQYVMAIALEQRTGNRPGRAGTYHYDLALFDFKRLHSGFWPHAWRRVGKHRPGPVTGSRSGPSASGRNTVPG